MTDLPATGDYDLPFPQYRCASCDKDLPLTEARIVVSCAEHRESSAAGSIEVREATSADRRDIEEICDRAYGETEVDVFGQTFDVLENVNLVAFAEGEFAGLISLAVEGGDLVVVLLSVYPEFQGTGVGSALVSAAIAYGEKRCLPGIAVAVTNDDVLQLYFYQRQGFSITDIAVGEASDRLGAAVPGFAGILVRDELHLRRSLCGC